MISCNGLVGFDYVNGGVVQINCFRCVGYMIGYVVCESGSGSGECQYGCCVKYGE